MRQFSGAEDEEGTGWDGQEIGGGIVALPMQVDLSPGSECADGRLWNPGVRGCAAPEI